MGKRVKPNLKRRNKKYRKLKQKSAQPETFEHRCEKLKSLFSQFFPEDVLISLSISDLWLPNISSQIKHTLAFSIAASIPEDSYSHTATINSYAEFQTFIRQVHSLLPNFPILEDYIPVTDWGEIKYTLEDENIKIFYGGVLERTPDFIAGFEILQSSNPQAITDLGSVLYAQNEILRGTSKKLAGDASNFSPGNIETPTSLFWNQCRQDIIALSKQPYLGSISKSLSPSLGELSYPTTGSDFSNSCFTGKALPVPFVKINGLCYPLSLRNSVATIIEFWESKDTDVPIQSISNYISSRFSHVIAKPFKIFSEEGASTQTFSAALLDSEKPHLIFALKPSELDKLAVIEEDIRKIIQHGNWFICPSQEDGLIKLNTSNGIEYPKSIDDITISAVISTISTSTGMLGYPATKIQVIPLSDFVGVFDSTEDSKELDRFYSFLNSRQTMMGMASNLADRFAAFKDSDEILVGGATSPTNIFLDPHWGSSGRYQTLLEHWQNSPPNLPDIKGSQWKPKLDQTNLFTLQARSIPALSWTTVVKNCSVHFVLNAHAQDIKIEDGRLVELLIHCLADSINQRLEIINALSIFDYRRITVLCQANIESLLSTDDLEQNTSELFSDWVISQNLPNSSLTLTLDVNTRYVSKNLSNVTDASFEVSALTQWLTSLHRQLNLIPDQNILTELTHSKARKPRFNLAVIDHDLCVPEYADPEIPSPAQYKTARRNLAVIFKTLGAQEKIYGPEQAKLFIDQARDKFKNDIHDEISGYSGHELVLFCIEQIDSLATLDRFSKKRAELSLSHEVDYSRGDDLAEKRKEFTLNSRNYRYLIEASYSTQGTGRETISASKMTHLIAKIDWLMVLYSLSDTLHNELDEAGIDLSDDFIPQVYYKEMNEENQAKFSSEAANIYLGVGLNEADEVKSVLSDNPKWVLLDKAFKDDTGISINNFLACFEVMYLWPYSIGESDLQFSYTAKHQEIIKAITESLEGVTLEDAEKFIRLVGLSPKNIRRLIGKSNQEGDVPLWEHNKRGDRYTIKPLIKNRNSSDTFTWGAAAMKQASIIWKQSFSNGYMTADYDWPNVKTAVRNIKQELEMALETNTENILSRTAPYSRGGIDFKRSFKSEGFEDVGDFDGLAYWPENNIWVTVECKYNQPTFCLKDARRFRDKIYGNDKKAHLPKIEKRRKFLLLEMERICNLLNWPAPSCDTQPVIHELYVSRDIYWWMRNPPYQIETIFVQVDALQQWLIDNNLSN